VRKIVEESKMEESVREECIQYLRHKDPHFDHVVIGETNIDVFLRDPITEAASLRDSLHQVFNVYSPRPCLGVRKQDEEG